MPTPNMWWIVANDNDPEHGWHWDEFFKEPGDPEPGYHWGGPGWIRSSASFARIERMRRGDPVAAYQSGQGILGFATLASPGRVSERSGNHDYFYLAPSPLVRLAKPIPYGVIRDLPGSKDKFQFVKFHQGTVFDVSSEGQAQLLTLATQFNPPQAAKISQFRYPHAA